MTKIKITHPVNVWEIVKNTILDQINNNLDASDKRKQWNIEYMEPLFDEVLSAYLTNNIMELECKAGSDVGRVAKLMYHVHSYTGYQIYTSFNGVKFFVGGSNG